MLKNPWLLMVLALLLSPVLHAQKAQKQEKPKTVQTDLSTLKNLLQTFKGKETNLGTLKDIAADYFTVEREGVVSMLALNAMHSLRLEKDEETGETVLEIRMLARD